MNFQKMSEIIARSKDNLPVREWSQKDDIWELIHNVGPELKSKIKEAIRVFFSHPYNVVTAKGANENDSSMKIALAQILLDLAREYDPQ